MTTIKKGSRGNDVKTLQKMLHLLEDGIFGVLTEEAVKEFQKANGLVADGVVGEKTWAKLTGGVVPSKRTIKEIIVHCTATPEGKDYTVETIRSWHKAQGWADIGYHHVIYRDGSVHDGRNIDIAGAHCTGHNSYSIGIVYVGGYASDGKTAKDTRTEAQKKALVELLRKLRRIYPTAKIYGHRDFANKDCPCFDPKKEYSII